MKKVTEIFLVWNSSASNANTVSSDLIRVTIWEKVAIWRPRESFVLFTISNELRRNMLQFYGEIRLTCLLYWGYRTASPGCAHHYPYHVVTLTVFHTRLHASRHSVSTKVFVITNMCQMERGGGSRNYGWISASWKPWNSSSASSKKSLFRWPRSVLIYHTSYQKEVTDIKSWTRARTTQTKSKQRYSTGLRSDTYSFQPQKVSAHPISGGRGGGKHRHAPLCSINVRSRNFLSRKLNSQYCGVKQKGSPWVESSWWSRSCSLC